MLAETFAAALIAVIILSAVPVSAGAADFHARDKAHPIDVSPVDTGRIEVVHPDGGRTTLEAALGEGAAIVHFWATWCVPCRAELPELARFRARLTEGGLAEEGLADRLLVISLDRSSYERVAAFVSNDLGLSEFKTLQNTDGRAGPAFGLFGLPATALLDGQRRIVALAQGPVDWNDQTLADRLRRHLAGGE